MWWRPRFQTVAKHFIPEPGEGTGTLGLACIRQAVGGQKRNITLKILYNDAVAMTAGNPWDGPISVAGIAQTCRAERGGADRAGVVSSTIRRADFPQAPASFAPKTWHIVQRDLREVKGVSVADLNEQTVHLKNAAPANAARLEGPKNAFAFINPGRLRRPAAIGSLEATA